jgi:hypothetical protein
MMVYDESYGELSHAQRAAYRKHNVSPSDHDELVFAYGDDRGAIVAAVKRHSPQGFFEVFRLWQERFHLT